MTPIRLNFTVCGFPVKSVELPWHVAIVVAIAVPLSTAVFCMWLLS